MKEGPYESGKRYPQLYETVKLSNKGLWEADKERESKDKFFPAETVLDALERIVHPRQFIISDFGGAIDKFLVGKKFWLQPAGANSEKILVEVINSRKPSARGKRYVLLQSTDDSSILHFSGQIVNVYSRADSENVIGVIHPGESNDGGGRGHSGQPSYYGSVEPVISAQEFTQTRSPEIKNIRQVATYEHDAALGTATIAVLDSGIQFTGPTRAGQVAGCSDISWNFVTSPALGGDAFPKDDHPGLHGTKICTIIKHAAPDVGILPVKVSNAKGTLSMYDALCGLEFARTHGARVVNASWSFTASSGSTGEESDYPLLLQAIRDLQESGIVVVAAAGNRNQYDQNADGHIGLNGAPNIYPACYSSIQDNVITVTTVVDPVASGSRYAAFENYSNRFVDTGVVANAGAPQPHGQFKVTGFHASYQGSSFATPYVAAKIAQIISATPGYTSKRAMLHRLQEFHVENQLADEICNGGSYITT